MRKPTIVVVGHEQMSDDTKKELTKVVGDTFDRCSQLDKECAGDGQKLAESMLMTFFHKYPQIFESNAMQSVTQLTAQRESAKQAEERRRQQYLAATNEMKKNLPVTDRMVEDSVEVLKDTVAMQSGGDVQYAIKLLNRFVQNALTVYPEILVDSGFTTYVAKRMLLRDAADGFKQVDLDDKEDPVSRTLNQLQDLIIALPTSDDIQKVMRQFVEYCFALFPGIILTPTYARAVKKAAYETGLVTEEGTCSCNKGCGAPSPSVWTTQASTEEDPN